MLKNVGFLGPKGTFSHEALEMCYQDEKVNAIEYVTINEVIEAVEKDEIQECIVPIENSIEGSVNTTLDTLSKSIDLQIIKELVISISNNLIIKKGTKLENVKYILTHPQPSGQCREYINKNFPNAQIVYTNSTAEGVKLLCEKDDSYAAIGTKKAAEIFNLEIAQSDIQDNNNNKTRFVVLSKNNSTQIENCKTSIIFSADDKPGSLYKILNIFSLWDINLTKIESRPQKDELGKYIFFVDLEGHIGDSDVNDALTMIKRKASLYKFLGSYPKG